MILCYCFSVSRLHTDHDNDCSVSKILLGCNMWTDRQPHVYPHTYICRMQVWYKVAKCIKTEYWWFKNLFFLFNVILSTVNLKSGLKKTHSFHFNLNYMQHACIYNIFTSCQVIFITNTKKILNWKKCTWHSHICWHNISTVHSTFYSGWQ